MALDERQVFRSTGSFTMRLPPGRYDLDPEGEFLAQLYETPLPSNVEYHLLFAYDGRSASDGVAAFEGHRVTADASPSGVAVLARPVQIIARQRGDDPVPGW